MKKKYGKAFPGEASFTEYVQKAYLTWARANKRSWRDDEMHARVICDYFAGKAFNDIDREMIEGFKEARRNSITRRGRQRTPATVNRELEVLSKIFSLAVDDGIIESNSCRKVKKLRMDNQRTHHLTVTEEEKSMAALAGRRAHLKPLVIVALYTGMRRGELFGLRKEHVKNKL